MSRAVVIFARAPEVEAAVKGLPSRFAELFHRNVAAWLRTDAAPIISCAPNARARFDAILPSIERLYIDQRGSTFGERLASTAEAAFALGFDEVVIAGIDAPPPDADVFAALAFARAAVVPSRDGGINLIALRAPERELLSSIEPRQRDVLTRCRAYFGDALAVLEVSSDVDSLAVERWPLAEGFAPVLPPRLYDHVTRPPPIA
jgi:hypothetical protein